MSINVAAKFDRTNINREEDYEGNLLVTIEAEDEAFERTPVQAILVIDTSGSMAWGSQGRNTIYSWAPQGENRALNTGSKIDAVKETARKIVENLTNKDEIAIVTFSNNAETILKLQKVENKEAIYNIINSIPASGNTNFSGGLIEGLRNVNNSFEGVKRLMVLTDGCPTAGLVDPDQLIELVEKRDSTASLSFFGFGTDCNNELLASMAKAGGGNHYFIEKTDEIKSMFARELGGLVSCKAQNIVVKIKPREGNEVLEVLNDFTVEEEGTSAIIKAEDIYIGEKKKIIAKMKISKPSGKTKDRPFSLGRVEITFFDLDTKTDKSLELNPKAKFVAPEEADQNPDVEVAEAAALLLAAKAQLEAVKLANQGDFQGAQAFYSSGIEALRFAADSGSDLAGVVLADYSSEMDNFSADNYTMSYAASTSNNARSFTRGREVRASAFSASIGATKAQKKMIKSFEEGTQPAKKADVADMKEAVEVKFAKKSSRS